MTLKKKKLAFGGPMPQYEDQQYASSQQVANLMGAIPVWGKFTKIGQAIGAKTMDQNGIYKSRAAGVLDNAVNPSTGIQNLKDVFRKPTASGLLNQFTMGVFGQSATQKRRKQEMAAQKTAWQNQQNQISGTAFANEQMGEYSSNQPKAMFSSGGQMTKIGMVKGGHLEKISPSAVQVKANQPAKKDGVETPTAMLDHNEVVDKDKRVYSDELKHHDGRSIAAHAKVIEEGRAGNPHADQDLDDLYQFQESQKIPTMKLNRAHSTAYQKSSALTIAPADAKQHLASGGTIHINPANKGKFNALKARTGKSTEQLSHSSNPLTKKRAVFAQNASHWNHSGKKGMAMGGQMDTTKPPNTSSPMMTLRKRFQPMGRTRMGLRIKPDQGPVKEPGTSMTNVPNQAGRSVKIRNFTRSGYR